MRDAEKEMLEQLFNCYLRGFTRNVQLIPDLAWFAPLNDLFGVTMETGWFGRIIEKKSN